MLVLGSFMGVISTIVKGAWDRRRRARGRLVTDLDLAHESRRYLWQKVDELAHLARKHGAPEEEIGAYHEWVTNDPWKSRQVSDG